MSSLWQLTGAKQSALLPVAGHASTYTVGRKDQDVTIDGDKSISRAHCTLEVGADNTLYVTDPGSKFGTFVNGTKLDVLVAAPADARVGLARLVSTHAAAKTHHWALALVFESERNCKVAHHFLMEKRALARERRRSALRAQLAAVATPEGGAPAG